MFNLIKHPLIEHKLSIMRDKNTGTKEFRELVAETSSLLFYEATRDLPLTEISVETPITTAKTKVIAGHKIAIVALLRAGLGMVDGITSLMPSAKIGHMGLYRDEHTLEAVKYYIKLPDDIAERDVIIVDPLLATGVTAKYAVKHLKEKGAKNIKFMCILAAPEGKEALETAYPDVEIFCGHLDISLNEQKFIYPGIGDAGDRIFGTK
ncbi:MAG: uracil phosphoribosyltransferase [Ruminococcus sp.]|jgi:uracil phosphoribosyltransferase|nr:uracil phosphoribosyltransferase [Ruminococcus sp.]